VTTLLNTHHHGDHTFGNFRFPGATIIGHERLRENLLAWGAPRSAPYWEEVEWGDVELCPPGVTFADRLSVFVDDLECDFRYAGTAAHTTNDSVLWVPDRQLLFSGDILFNGGTPFMVQGSPAGMLTALDMLEGLGAETIVPGHGEVCGPEVIGRVRGYVRFVQELAAKGHNAGLAPLEVARETDLGEYAEWLDSERIVGNLHRAYAELDGAAPGAPIDARAALDDMVTFNGGRPLTCHA
jgi:cyclase